MASNPATNKGIQVSFGNTPQAVDDVFSGSSYTGLREGTLGIVTLDVMGNDKAGGAKSLYSLDNDAAGSIRPTDLLNQDIARSAAASLDTSKLGAKIWITDSGEVAYDANSLSSTVMAQLERLGSGEYIEDTFVY